VSLETAGGTYVRVKVRCSKLLLKLLLVDKLHSTTSREKHMHQPVVPKTVKQGQAGHRRRRAQGSACRQSRLQTKRQSKKKVMSLSAAVSSKPSLGTSDIPSRRRHPRPSLAIHPAASSGATHRPVRASHSDVLSSSICKDFFLSLTP
jgi:hypothetical protein